MSILRFQPRRNWGVPTRGLLGTLTPSQQARIGEADDRGVLAGKMRPVQKPRQIRSHYMNVQLLWVYGIVLYFALFALAVWLIVSPAHAKPHGWDENNPFSKWVATLRIPDEPALGCCGKGDLYSIEILREPAGKDAGVAIILDGSALEFPDGDKRPAIADGTQFEFGANNENPPKDGHMGPNAWAFLTVSQGQITRVWCVVPIPPGY